MFGSKGMNPKSELFAQMLLIIILFHVWTILLLASRKMVYSFYLICNLALFLLKEAIFNWVLIFEKSYYNLHCNEIEVSLFWKPPSFSIFKCGALLRYVLVSKPTEWTDKLREKFLEGFEVFLQLLKRMQVGFVFLCLIKWQIMNLNVELQNVCMRVNAKCVDGKQMVSSRGACHFAWYMEINFNLHNAYQQYALHRVS